MIQIKEKEQITLFVNKVQISQQYIKQLSNYFVINKYNIEMQSQDDLISSYIMNTKFYDEMRAIIKGHLTSKQIKQLVQSINSMARYKQEKVTIKLSNAVIILIIYGELGYCGSMYSKGQYIKIDVVDEEIQMNFLKSSTLIFISSELLNLRLEQLANYRRKTDIILKCIPVRQMKLCSLDIKKIAKLLQIKCINQKYYKIQHTDGIFLFFDGIFQICFENIPILQMEHNFIQITDKFQFSIKLKVNQGKYGYISRQNFYDNVGPDSIIQMEKAWKLKQQLKQTHKVRHQYINETDKLRQKIKDKLKKNKKMNPQQKNSIEKFQKQALETSRNSMLQKCSTNVTTSRTHSLFSSRKNNDYEKKQRTQSSLHSLNKTFEIPGQIKINKSQKKLQQLRKFDKLKNRTQLQSNWYHIETQKTEKKLNQTYWKIKKTQNSREAKIYSNYKRIHRIYSDPCFKKSINFRNF